MVYGGMEKPKDYYQLLGVARDASASAIRRAFQRLTRRLEPEHGEAGIAELQAAYETLSDAERRRRYDDELGSRSSPLDWSLDVPVAASCDACSGTGGSLFDCGRCGGEGRVLRRMPVPVHVPAGLREGSVFQVRTDEPAVPTILLTVHIRM